MLAVGPWITDILNYLLQFFNNFVLLINLGLEGGHEGRAITLADGNFPCAEHRFLPFISLSARRNQLWDPHDSAQVWANFANVHLLIEIMMKI